MIDTNTFKYVWTYMAKMQLLWYSFKERDTK